VFFAEQHLEMVTVHAEDSAPAARPYLEFTGFALVFSLSKKLVLFSYRGPHYQNINKYLACDPRTRTNLSAFVP
jgi:hypothetical protein